MTNTDRTANNTLLAKAMGYTVRQGMYGSHLCFDLLDPAGHEVEGGDGWSEERKAWAYCPDFYTDPTASRELVLWLRTSPYRALFAKHYQDLLYSTPSGCETPFWLYMAAPPETIADAAVAAIAASSSSA